ncbi:MAG: bifunctional pyr operon transcriptional regulator/uracil phosphoribosyltransferase PyrR [Bacteroidetes bacterium]|nr:bifunctional pyr operon transcriptional regulator/uracil phosphoribosyltransferase PyrR [Bacteroidota bacterium]MCB9226955.1 bifunctional pyr operon transcriptional regulator/uracil phosphoribosyltransferase PyrR [Chitinophagales bacterium]
MNARIILDATKFKLVIDRLCYQLIENHRDFENTVLLGVQPRGTLLASRIFNRIKEISPKNKLQYGKLDVTFYRDDFRKNSEPLRASEMDIPFSLEDKNIILVDDVLYTGRTIRSALEALIDFGRPADVELLVLIDRRLHRHVPIQAKYIGKTIDSITDEKVKVEWSEQGVDDKVWIVDKK